MPTPPTVRTVSELRGRVGAWRAAGAAIALVPTMGALHEGHLSLVRLARRRAEKVVASVFVNPTQFAPNEDFHNYPRDEARDAAMLADAGCDLLFAPGAATMYPPGFATTIEVAGLTSDLEGALRPTHFTGVATTVAKLLIQAAPDFAVFGEKDFQQLQVIRRLADDLDLAVEIVGAPIIRDADGLALSSRNAYLDLRQRAIAPGLHRALLAAAAALKAGEETSRVESEGAEALARGGFDQVDYFQIRSSRDLKRLGPGVADGPARILAAARLGKTRLLDNMAV